MNKTVITNEAEVLQQTKSASPQEEAEMALESSVVLESSNEVSSEILFEDTTKRSENAKHFRMKNGHYMAAVYDKPVHTFDKVTGKFVDIAHRFEEKEECFEAETDRFKARFPKKEGKRKFVTVEKDGRSVSWRYIPTTNSHMKHAVAAIHQYERASLMELPRFPQLKYEKTEGQIDLEYGITEQGVKENIVLAKRPKHSTFRFELKLDGLRAVLAEDKKSIRLFAEDIETDEPEFIIPPINMTDAAGVYSEAARYELVEDEIGTVMEIVIDPQWLLAEERLYPVTVDPQIFMYNNGYTNPWTMTSIKSNNQKTTDSYALRVGYDKEGTENRIFMKVTLDNPPQGYMITEAMLRLAQQSFASNGTTTQYEVRAVDSNWTINSLSWNSQPQTDQYPVLDTFIGEERDSNKEFIKLNITDQVKQWYEEDLATGSLVVKLAGSEAATVLADASADSEATAAMLTASMGAAARMTVPSVTLASTRTTTACCCECNGSCACECDCCCDTSGGNDSGNTGDSSSEDNTTTPPEDTGNSGGNGNCVDYTDYVDLYTNKMSGIFSPLLLVTYASADSYADHQKSESFEFGQAGSGVVNLFNGKLTFVHSDVSTQGNPLPLSISHIYRSEFSEDTAANDTYGHGWILSANQKMKLVNEQDVKAIYRDAQGRQHYFIVNDDGTITDDAGMELFYEDKCNSNDREYLYRLHDQKGNEMLFDEDGNLFRISDAKQNTCKFTYENGLLKKITDGSGRTATLGYNSSNRLTWIKDNQNRILRFTYNGDLLTKITYPYDTKATDPVIETTIFEYDANKHLIKIIDRAEMQYQIDYANKKVTSVKQIDDDNNQNFVTKFEYYARSTAVTDGITDLKMVYRYDENGRVRSSYEDITGTTLTKGEMPATTLGEYESLQNTHDESKSYTGKYRSVSASVTQSADQYCNILKNGYFDNNAVSWRSGGHSTKDGWGAKENSDPYNYYKLDNTTSTSASKYLRQEVTQCTECLNGNVLVASAWACANNHVTNTSVSDTCGAKFELKVTLKYEDGTSDSCTEKFDSARSDWQYVAFPIALIKGKAIAKIVYTLDFSGNSGTVKFANARLFAVRGNITEILYNISQPSELNTLKAFAKEAKLEKDIWIRRAIIRSDGRRDTIEFEDNSSDIVISKIPAIDGYTNFTNLYLYDAAHQLIKSLDYRNFVTEYTYDDFGNVTLKKVHPKNSDNQFVERSEYSANGAHLLKAYTPRSNTVCTEYAYTNDLVSKRTDPNDQEYTYGYNTYNDKMTSVSATVGGDPITNGFTYEHGNLICVAHNGYNYHFDYDKLGRTISIRTDEHPADAPLVSMAYTMGAVSTVRTTYANGYTSIVTTDARGNPVEKRVGKSANLTDDDVTSTAEYDEMGNPVELVDKLRNVCYTYKYNRDGNVTMITEKSGNGSETRTTMAYDEQTGRMTVKSYGATGQRYEMQYEANGSGDVYPDDVVNGITLSGKFTERVEKDYMNRVGKRVLTLSGASSSAFTDTYTYWCENIGSDGIDERTTTLPESVTHTVPNGGAGSESYTYNDSDHITRVSGNQNASYTYDGLNRLIREFNTDANRKYEWTYDDGGNILTKKETDTTSNVLLYTTTYHYEDIWKDKLTSRTIKDEETGSETTETFVYDALGNPTTYRGHTLEWTNVRRLKKYDNVQFTYGADGIRTSKTSNNVTTTYTLDGNRILRETDGTKTLTYFYGLNDVIGFRYNSIDYYYVKNVQGDVLALYDESGNLVVKYVYDAWGKVLSVKNSNGNEITDVTHVGIINPFRYRSYYYDTETNLYYLETRYYDPAIDRFINLDSLEYLGESDELSNYNLFTDCNNAPSNYKSSPVSFGGSISTSSVSSAVTHKIFNLSIKPSNGAGSTRVNWENGGFQIPIWISSLMSASDFGASIAPGLRTISQYVCYPGVKDLNKLYGLDFVPGKLNTVCTAVGYGLLGANIVLSAISNFTNDNLTTKQQWISFGVDTAYTLGTFGIGYGVGALVSLIPGVGVFIAPFASAGATWLIDLTNEKWGWLDDVKQWFNDL